MTAEILRNSLFRTLTAKASLLPLTSQEDLLTSKSSTNTNYEWDYSSSEIGCVILDEIHYINNYNRGKIWEEILIHLEPHIQLVMLSGTITGAIELANWVGNLKKIKCHLISTFKRPIPLQHGIWWNNEITYFLFNDHDWKENVWQKKYNEITKHYNSKSFSLNQFFDCINYLFLNNMTPVNIFLLNRKLIEKYSKKISLVFVNREESCQINKIWNKYLSKYKNLYDKTTEWINLYQLVIKGIGIHHSGMIPILKEIIEILYSQNLLKILLATETFAMGVNMPTKTVVFFNIHKYDDNHIRRPLYPEEYHQMAGRSGRRGKDNIGYVLILPSSNFINENEAKNMILTKPHKIQSKLLIDPHFILRELAYINDTLGLDISINNNIIINHIIDKFNKSLYYYQINKKCTVHDEVISSTIEKNIKIFDLGLF